MFSLPLAPLLSSSVANGVDKKKNISPRPPHDLRTTSPTTSWRDCVRISESRGSVHVAPGGAEITRWNTRHRQLCLMGNYRHFFGSWFSNPNCVKQRERSAQMWRRLRNVHVLLHVRAYGDCPVSLAMTHMRWFHGRSGHESTGHTRSVVQCVGGLRAWPIDVCSNKDAGRSQSETPTPCECEQARRQSRSDRATLSKFTC